MKKKAKLIFFLIGLVGVTVLILTSDLQNTDWGFFSSPVFITLFAGLLIIWAVIYALHTCTFKVILGEHRNDIGFFAMYKICVTGFGLNNVTPAGVAGGEPYRIMELSRYTKGEKAAATSLTFTLLYMAGHLLIWITEAILYFILGCPGETFSTIIISAVAAASVIAMSVVLFGKGQHVVEKTICLLTLFPIVGKPLKKFYDGKREKLEAIDREIVNFKKQPGKLTLALGIEYITRLLESLEYLMIFISLGVAIPPIAGIMILSNASLMGNILFFIPMQVGSRESGMRIALSWFTENTSVIAPACIIYRIRDIFCTLVGIFSMLIERRKKE